MQAYTLPAEQAAPALTDSFSLGYDPYTHACKARLPTIVGRTSLSVIVSLSHVNNARLKGHSDYGKEGLVAESVPELAEHMGLRSDQVVFLIAFWPPEQQVDHEEDRKTMSTNSSSLKRLRPKLQLKVPINTTIHGSKQQKTVEDGLY